MTPGDWALHFLLSAVMAIVYVSCVPETRFFDKRFHTVVAWIIVLSPVILAFVTIGEPPDEAARPGSLPVVPD